MRNIDGFSSAANPFTHMSINVPCCALALRAAPPQFLHVGLTTEWRLLSHVAPEPEVPWHILVLGAQRAPRLKNVPAQILLELLAVDLRA